MPRVLEVPRVLRVYKDNCKSYKVESYKVESWKIKAKDESRQVDGLRKSKKNSLNFDSLKKEVTKVYEFIKLESLSRWKVTWVSKVC